MELMLKDLLNLTDEEIRKDENLTPDTLWKNLKC